MAVPTNLAEALDLLTYSGGNQITGQDVREVVTWLAQPRTTSAYFPSGVASVDTDDVETRLNNNERLVLYGTLLLDRPIVITTGGGGIISSPELPAMIGQAPTWSGTGVSSASNSLFVLTETEAVTAATTPSATETPMCSPTLGVTSATGFTPGRYFKTLGISGANDYHEQSAGAGCPTEELLQCDSEAGGLVTHRITMRRHVGQNNATSPNKTLKLLDGAVDGFEIRGIRFDAYQSASLAGTNPVVACAISARFARNVHISDCAFKGFVGHSGAGAIYARGCRDWTIRRGRMLGANNSRVYFFSCQSFIAEVDDELEIYERTNTRGGQHGRFYAWVWRSQCHDIKLSGSIKCVPAAVQAWGGDHCALDVDVSDVRFQEIGLHAIGIPDDTGGRRGYILDTGANDVAQAEFGRYNRYRVRWTDAHSGTAKYWGGGSDIIQHWHAAIYMHDVFQSHWEIENSDLGRDPITSTAYRWLGLVSQDCIGTLNARLKGFVKGAAFIGTLNIVTVPYLLHNSGAGDGTTGYITTGYEAGILLDEGSQGLPYFVEVKHFGYHLVEFYSSFAFPLSGYQRVLIERIRWEALLYGSGLMQARDVVIAREANGAAHPGPLTMLPIDDTAGTVDRERKVTVALAAAPADGVFISLTINTNSSGSLRPIIGVLGGLQAEAPVYVAGATTVKTREFVECNASGHAVPATNGVNDLATLARIVGRARYKRINAGGTALMQLGP